MYICMYVAIFICLTKANTDRNNFNSKKNWVWWKPWLNNADIFYTFRPFRQADHWLSSRVLFCPSLPPTPAFITFLMVLSFINNSLVSRSRFKINSGFFKNGPREPGLFFLLTPPPPPRRGSVFISSPFEGGGSLIKTRGYGSLTTIFIWNYPTLPLKTQKISSNGEKGGTGNLIRLPYCLFPAKTRRPPFFDWLCPKDSLIIKNEKLKNKKVRGHAAEDQNQIRPSRVSRTIVRNQSQKWPEIEHMPTSNCSSDKISNRHHSKWLRATKRREKVTKVTLIKSFLCSEQFEVDIYSICGFGFSRENGRFNRVGQVSSLIPWRKLDGYQIF